VLVEACVVDYVDEFKSSFARVTERARCERFFDRFYGRFIGADEEVAAKFRKTDLAHQKEMLRESIAEMVDFFLKHASNPYLVTLARIHGVRGHDIPVRLYDLWLDCLVATVKEVDPKATESVELAWRIVMTPGIEFMKFYRSR
jgi:truncated hemoglobin YjbI